MWADVPAEPAAAVESREISVLTYNVRGLPWPVATGRAQALRAIGEQLAELRRQGRQPDVVLIQEGFRGEVADLVRASGYRHWVQGPSRTMKGGPRLPILGGGLHVLSDAPIADVERMAYGACAGFDCFANKGAMRVTLKLDGVPFAVDVVNTHMNSRRAARAPLARTLWAHNVQTEELYGFVRAGLSDRPVLIGGDFNVKNAPDRYAFRAEARPYTVVSEYCRRASGGCGPESPSARSATPWLKSQDLQAFTAPRPIAVTPVEDRTLFDGAAALSDHAAYLVRYRLTWSPAELAARTRPAALAAAAP
ncbi:endonuclease/exonuclease/phosphatase family protein [Phenylobacterium sp.]|uniref:endonuclease/exonuclease/phosphatase family protein n=1 Tax=Phenylobacterium sp. TaxID=1871053 RepID=UPI0039198F1F